MQNASPVLHNALCLYGLSHANELEMMEPSQVDGNLPLAWPWYICDSLNIIDAEKVQRGIDESQRLKMEGEAK